MSKSPIQQLAEFGQSPWLDYISRPLLETGELQKQIDNGLRGMTSNPAIFNKAIGSSKDYDEKIIDLKNAGKSTFEIYDALTIQDIQDAADIMQSVYEDTKGLDGYVSLEINPLLANKVDEQVKEGIRLYEEVDRKNVMIKVPSTPSGITVFEELIARGINVNVTLIFSLQQYVDTVYAYFRGLKRLSKTRDDLSGVRSVASVFISRIDSSVDKLIDQRMSTANEEEKNKLQSLLGKAAVSNARIIFEEFKSLFGSDEFQQLFDKNANVQRVLWASTSTKNPEYSDIKYVTELICKPTVNTIPGNTLEAFADHGVVKDGFENFTADDAKKSY